jgi:septum formation protein
MDKAGAYGIQGRFAAFIRGIEGSYTNVMGLPAGRLYQELKELMRGGQDD